MFKGGIGFGEILLILGVLALIFGASRLPQIGNSLGRSLREFKRGVTGGPEEESGQPKKSATGSDGARPMQH